MLVSLSRVQLLASSADIPAALEAATECETGLRSGGAMQSDTALLSKQLLLHCLLLKALLQLAAGETAVLQSAGKCIPYPNSSLKVC